LRAARFLGFSTLTRRGPRVKRADFEQGLPSYSAFRNPKSAGEDSSKENRQSERQPSIAFLALGKMRGWLKHVITFEQRVEIESKYRSEAWIDPPDYAFSDYFTSRRLDSREEDWKIVVDALCRIASVLIMDMRASSEATEAEILGIDSNDLWYKVALIVDVSLDDTDLQAKIAGRSKVFYDEDSLLFFVVSMSRRGLFPTRNAPIATIE